VGAGLAGKARTPKGDNRQSSVSSALRNTPRPQVGCSITSAIAAALISGETIRRDWLFAVDLGKRPFSAAAIS